MDRIVPTGARIAPLSGAEVDLFGAQRKRLATLRDEVGFTQKAGGKLGRGAFIKFLGVPDLFNRTVTHDHDPVRHRQRFFLIVGDVDECRANAAVDVFELFLHLDAQLFVERAQRFVQQQTRVARNTTRGPGRRAAAARLTTAPGLRSAKSCNCTSSSISSTRRA